MSNQDFFVVCLKQKRFIIIKKEWIQNPSIGQMSKIFYSKNEDAIPNFDGSLKYYLNRGIEACYEGYVQKSFDSLEKAENFIEWKRPFVPIAESNLNFEEPVDFIDLISGHVSQNSKIIY